ncbi:MAG: galactose mutarotase [Muribaculaceae bacterium]|nr:galactose mutarotase [Muribaculaceae bacterium]
MKVETKHDGDITLYTLTNDSGASVTLSSLGAAIVAVCVPDKNGKLDDVALGYKNPADYDNDGPCAGKTPGRYANRIALGRFKLNGTEYQLPVNNGPNCCHGGNGFQNKIWNSRFIGDGIRFDYSSRDGEEGFPGNVEVAVSYRWNDRNELAIEFSASTDAKTVINLTNHAYFNLEGHNSGSVLDHVLKLNASRWLPTDDTLIPTGEIAPVADTPMDFREGKTLGRDIRMDFPALKYGKGYDNCWVLDDWHKHKLVHAATLIAPASGRVLEVDTTQPAVQVYTGNWFTGSSPVNKEGRPYVDNDGVAIECQGMPDAPNQPAFPSQILGPGELYTQFIIYRFKTVNA